MSKCIKDYVRAGNRYVAGRSYDIAPELVKAHEKYLGEKLWEGAKKKKAPAEKTSKPKEETTKPKVEGKAKSKKK